MNLGRDLNFLNNIGENSADITNAHESKELKVRDTSPVVPTSVHALAKEVENRTPYSRTARMDAQKKGSTQNAIRLEKSGSPGLPKPSEKGSLTVSGTIWFIKSYVC